ncbi:type II secretion system protein GspK [Thioalkalivibrio sp. ALE23]|uniref:type II secretion system protein GspK n=1 Tax=Thioalkalivibrio sp. ALE23 TaxID=1265495 RepID=UPI00036E333B|nr:type II secretion system protein GspK [Thioalkalivibrio sp. ALE23]
MKRREHGVALLTALLVVALATLAAAAMGMRDHYQIQRMELMEEHERAWQTVRGAEEIALGMLGGHGAAYRHLPWEDDYECRTEPVEFDMDGMTVQARVHNLHCRFNLNSLGREEPSMEAFESLVTEMAAESGVSAPQGLGEAIRQWMDEEAELPEYRAMDPARSSGARPLTHASELLDVEGVTPAVYDALEPWVVARPGTGNRMVVTEDAPEGVRRAMEHELEIDASGEGIRHFDVEAHVRTEHRLYAFCTRVNAERGTVLHRQQGGCQW